MTPDRLTQIEVIALEQGDVLMGDLCAALRAAWSELKERREPDTIDERPPVSAAAVFDNLRHHCPGHTVDAVEDLLDYERRRAKRFEGERERLSGALLRMRFNQVPPERQFEGNPGCSYCDDNSEIATAALAPSPSPEAAGKDGGK